MRADASWAALVELAERERDLVREGRWEDVPAVSEQRLNAIEGLGAPPASARAHLERLVELQNEIHAGLAAGRALTLHKLADMRRGSTAMRGYAGVGRPAASTVDSQV